MIPTILQRYVLRDVLRVGALATIAVTVIMFIGMGVSLVQRGLSVVQLYDVIPYVMAFALPYSIPTALLTAVVFVFGKLAGTNELTAVRSIGVNLNHLILPPIILATIVSAGMFWVNHYLLPWANRHKSSMAREVVRRVLARIGTVQRVFPIKDYVIYVGHVDPRGGLWHNVAVIQFAGDEYPARIAMAREAHCSVDEENKVARLVLADVVSIQPRMDAELRNEKPKLTSPRWSLTIDLSDDDAPSTRPKYDHLPRLLERIRASRASAADIRRQAADPSVFDRPRTARRRIESERNSAYRAWQNLETQLETRRKAVGSAQAAQRKAEALLMEAKANHGAALQEYDDLGMKAADRRPTLQKMMEEMQWLVQRGAEAERIREREQEIRRETAAIEEIERKRAAVGARVEAAAREVARAEADFRDRATETAAAEAAVRSLDAEIAAAHKAFTALAARCHAARQVEDLLRARTEFHFRATGALTPLVFVLLGVPLGVLARRGSVLMAFLISFGTVLILYYPLLVVGTMLSADGLVDPLVTQWMPAVIVGGAGIALLTSGIRR